MPARSERAALLRKLLQTAACAGVFGATASFSPAMADAVCDRPTTREMVACLSQTIAAKEAELQKFYGIAVNAKDPDGRKILQASQYAWLAYREKQCALEGDAVRGRSLRPIYEGQCYARLLDQRIRELKDHSDSMAH